MKVALPDREVLQFWIGNSNIDTKIPEITNLLLNRRACGLEKKPLIIFGSESCPLIRL